MSKNHLRRWFVQESLFLFFPGVVWISNPWNKHTKSLKQAGVVMTCQDTKVTFTGHGYVEEIAWELPEVHGDEEDILNLGEVCSWDHTGLVALRRCQLRFEIQK